MSKSHCFIKGTRDFYFKMMYDNNKNIKFVTRWIATLQWNRFVEHGIGQSWRICSTSGDTREINTRRTKNMSDGGSKMNHIYKVVWSKVKNCYVVVSEIARNGGKEHSRHAKKMPGGVYILPLALALNFGLPSSSQAAVPADLGNGAAATYDAHGNLVIGNEGTVAEGSKRAGSNNTTIGTDSDTLRKVADGDTSGQPMDTKDNTKLVEGEGQAHDLDDYRSTEAGGSTAVGYDNHNEGDRSTAIGNHAIIANKPVTYYVDADGNKTASPDNAVWYKDTTSGKPTKVPQVFRDADGNTTTAPQ